jgi:hypothetical protein
LAAAAGAAGAGVALILSSWVEHDESAKSIYAKTIAVSEKRLFILPPYRRLQICLTSHDNYPENSAISIVFR